MLEPAPDYFEGTVLAPSPKCASAIRQTGPARIGSREVRSACSRALSSSSLAHEVRLALIWFGIVFTVLMIGHIDNQIVRQILSFESRWRVSNSRGPAYEAGAQPPEHHRRGTPDTIRTCTRWVWASCLFRLGYRGQVVGVPGADPDAEG